MQTTAEASAAILAAVEPAATESIDSLSAVGRVLRQSVVAERDQPPFDRVMMDGIAIDWSSFENGQRDYPVQATQSAGDPALTLTRGHCIEIMTGAALPAGADCIVPVERIAVTNGVATIEAEYQAKERQFIHPRGSDHRMDTVLLTPGKRLTALDMAIVQSAGLEQIDVSRQPVIRVISTGNELVAAGTRIADHQIRLSNGPAVIAMLQQHGYQNAVHDHLPDDLDTLRDRIGGHLESADVLVLSGGVSMGKSDFVPQVLGELGVSIVIHRISQRPGKPMWFGTGPQGQAVFALPGNPVSTLVCCRQYVIPALRHASVEPAPAPEFASLAQPYEFRPDLTCFLPARLISSANGQVLALPVTTNTSGDFAALSATDGYIELPKEQSEFPVGTPLRLHRWA